MKVESGSFQWCPVKEQEAMGAHKHGLFCQTSGTQKPVFTVEVNEHWHSSPRDVVELSPSGIFKNHQDIVLGSSRCPEPF